MRLGARTESAPLTSAAATLTPTTSNSVEDGQRGGSFTRCLPGGPNRTHAPTPPGPGPPGRPGAVQLAEVLDQRTGLVLETEFTLRREFPASERDLDASGSSSAAQYDHEFRVPRPGVLLHSDTAGVRRKYRTRP